MALLSQAPINNIDAERSVGSINYELDRRGAQQLAAVGVAHYKAKSVNLVELRPPDSYIDYTEKAKRVNELVAEWVETQANLE